MTEWTDLNWVNVFFVFLSGFFAYECFEDGREGWGWFNVFASASNAAAVALRLI
jgi:hypothetical protein